MKLDEINMSPSNLKAMAAKLTDARIGIEFELIVRDVGHYDGDPEDFEAEPDYEINDSINDSSWEAFSRDIMNFFRGEHNSRRSVEHSLSAAENDFNRWYKDQWEEFIEENLAQWVKDTYPDFTGDVSEYKEEFEDEHKQDFGDRNSNLASWMSYVDVENMQEFAASYNLDWPSWTDPEGKTLGEGSRDFNEISTSFSRSVGRPVKYHESYHSDSKRLSSNGYIMEPDGSLEPDDRSDFGLEFVGPPLSVGDAIDQIHKVKKWAVDENNAYTNKSCGLHMNVSFPGFDLDNLDYVKLAVFLGDDWVSSQFGRLGNSYADSSINSIKKSIVSAKDYVPRMLDKLKQSLNLAASKLVHNGITSKYMSINTKDNRVEFRSPGGNWLEMDINVVINTMLRCVVALDIALNPEKEKKEYTKRLYKLISPKKDDAIGLFALYQSGLLSQEQLKQRWARLVYYNSNATSNQKSTDSAKGLASKIIQRRYWSITNAAGDEITKIDAPTWDSALAKAREYVRTHNITGHWEIVPLIVG